MTVWLKPLASLPAYLTPICTTEEARQTLSLGKIRMKMADYGITRHDLEGLIGTVFANERHVWGVEDDLRTGRLTEDTRDDLELAIDHIVERRKKEETERRQRPQERLHFLRFPDLNQARRFLLDNGFPRGFLPLPNVWKHPDGRVAEIRPYLDISGRDCERGEATVTIMREMR